MNVHIEYDAAIRRLHRMRTRAPRKFTNILTNIGIVEASRVIEDLDNKAASATAVTAARIRALVGTSR